MSKGQTWSEVTELEKVAGGTEADAVAHVARLSVAPHALEPGRRFVVRREDGSVDVCDTFDVLPLTQAEPFRMTGSALLLDTASFVAYVRRHQAPGLTVWANPAMALVTAVLNDHTPDDPGWGDHRAVLSLIHSDPWKALQGVHRKGITQDAFAEFVEDHLRYISEPAGADLLEIAQTFQASGRMVFRSVKRLASGETDLQYQQEVNATAGAAGQLQVPNVLVFRLPVFDGSDPVTVNVRLRYRVASETLTITLVVDELRDVERAAVVAECDQISELLGEPVYFGAPGDDRA